MDTIDKKYLLLEIRKMKIQLEIAEKHHADTTKALQNHLSQQISQPPLFPPTARLENAPHLPEEQKLASSASSNAPMWRHVMTARMNRYGSYFCDEVHRIEFIYENTKDEAAKFLRSYILDPPSDRSPFDFVDFVADAFTDPTKRENATAEFERLTMAPRELFWDFWTKFRTLAADTEYRDDRFLREQLRSKVLIRLSNAVQTKWTRCHTLNDYFKVLQEADAHYQSIQHRQKRQATTFSPADERHSNFPSSSAIPKNQK
ncbi:simnilar to predicted protein from Sclerotinia sclerotiorum [Golovinomyces cichoracearum]|uniref:Retrotransposon gag domain-containing protein n=1 Tax=Golovinomyces cichoracearum TaxID=62708 RepID=A0A420J567_9PEZI|nr:simnilar to predicted protein from Sclerotinia sclerotiorum [Golovinomyces cichoracearum]